MPCGLIVGATVRDDASASRKPGVPLLPRSPLCTAPHRLSVPEPSQVADQERFVCFGSFPPVAGTIAPIEFLLRSTRVLACCSGPETNLDARNVLGTPYPLPGAVRERAPHKPRFDSGSEMGRLPCVESAVPCVPPSGLVHAGTVRDRHPAG